MTDQQRERNIAGLVIGVIILLIGAALLLDQIGLIDGVEYVPFWPVILITVGLVKLSHRPDHGRRHGGWWVFIGVALLLDEMRVLRFRESWPLFLVAAGIAIVWKALVHPGRAHEIAE